MRACENFQLELDFRTSYDEYEICYQEIQQFFILIESSWIQRWDGLSRIVCDFNKLVQPQFTIPRFIYSVYSQVSHLCARMQNIPFHQHPFVSHQIFAWNWKHLSMKLKWTRSRRLAGRLGQLLWATGAVPIDLCITVIQWFSSDKRASEKVRRCYAIPVVFFLLCLIIICNLGLFSIVFFSSMRIEKKGTLGQSCKLCSTSDTPYSLSERDARKKQQQNTVLDRLGFHHQSNQSCREICVLFWLSFFLFVSVLHHQTRLKIIIMH